VAARPRASSPSRAVARRLRLLAAAGSKPAWCARDQDWRSRRSSPTPSCLPTRRTYVVLEHEQSGALQGPRWRRASMRALGAPGRTGLLRVPFPPLRRVRRLRAVSLQKVDRCSADGRPCRHPHALRWRSRTEGERKIGHAECSIGSRSEADRLLRGSAGEVVDRRMVNSLSSLEATRGPGAKPPRVAIKACREAWFVHPH
jgi:hypothetical protein